MADSLGLTLGAVLLGAGASAVAGFYARRYEDKRARRADLLEELGGVVKALVVIEAAVQYPNADPFHNTRRELDEVTRAAYRHGIACSRADARRGKRLVAATNDLVLCDVRPGPASESVDPDVVDDWERVHRAAVLAANDWIMFLTRKLVGRRHRIPEARTEP